MGLLDNRVALITGSAMGIGRGMAEAMLEAGASVMLTDINAQALAATEAQLNECHPGRVAGRVVDVTDRAQVIAMVEATHAHFGRLDALVNNAWKAGRLTRLEKLTDEQLRGGYDMAVMAAFWAMQAALPYFRQQGGGRIINLCSLNGVNAHMYSGDYNAAKEALRSLTRTAAREWAGDQICCNIICPGAASAAYQRFAEANPDNARAMAQANPMGRVGDPKADIGPVAVFLASDGARYLTGNTLFVDGGSHINGVSWAPQPAE